MGSLAAEIAQANHFPDADYRSVLKELKKQQVTGEAILPFYEKRLKEIEQLIVQHKIVSLWRGR